MTHYPYKTVTFAVSNLTIMCTFALLKQHFCLFKKIMEQAGAELCQAQGKLNLIWP